MRTIYKYQLGIADEQKVEMPYVFKFRHVAAAPGPSRQSPRLDRINVWAEVDSDAPSKWTRFYVVGTGSPVPPEGVYVGTAPMLSGLVWHVFWAADL